MSDQKGPPVSSYGRRRPPVKTLSFFDRHYRSVHHVVVLLGVSAFFGPFVYRYYNRPSLDEIVYSPGTPRPDYEAIERKLDKWR